MNFLIITLFVLFTTINSDVGAYDCPDLDGDGVTESCLDNEGKWEQADGDTCPTVYNPGDAQEIFGYAYVFDHATISFVWKKTKGVGPGLGAIDCSTDFNGDGVANGVDIAAMNYCVTDPNVICPVPPKGHRVGDYNQDGNLTRDELCQLATYQHAAGIDVWYTVLINCGIVNY